MWLHFNGCDFGTDSMFTTNSLFLNFCNRRKYFLYCVHYTNNCLIMNKVHLLISYSLSSHPSSIPLSTPEQARPRLSATWELHQSVRPSETWGLSSLRVITERCGEGGGRLRKRRGRSWGCGERDGQGGEPSRREGRWREEEDVFSTLYRNLERYEEETLGHCREQVLQQGHYDRYSDQHHQHGHRAPQPGKIVNAVTQTSILMYMQSYFVIMTDQSEIRPLCYAQERE